MLLLGLDTATLTLSAALVERGEGGDRLLERVVEPPPTPHSSLLPGVLTGMLERANAKVSDLGAVVIGLGPGSFTGLRIGLATAKGLCYAAGIPLVGASSLASMALAAAAEVSDGSLLVPCLDARKGEVYCGFYRVQAGGVVAEGPEAHLDPSELLERLSTRPEARVFGIGREAYPVLQTLPCGVVVQTPDAFGLVRLVQDVPAFSKQVLFGLEPHYVRPSDSEWTVRKKKPKQPSGSPAT